MGKYSHTEADMKVFLKIVLSIMIIFILIIAGAGFFITRGLSAGSKLVINNVNLSSLRDGEYIGKYKGGRWTNEVKVTVKDNKITDIKIEKDVLIPKAELTQELISNVIEAQSLDIDVVSGSTVTTKAYLKAIEIALEGDV